MARQVRNSRRRRVAQLAASLLVVAIALAVVVGAAAVRAQTTQIFAGAPNDDGARLINSRAGEAIFGGTGLLPGDVRRGSVTITNAGDQPAHFYLEQRLATTGTTTGNLTRVLQLRVEDVTGGVQRLVYTGPLGGFVRAELGVFAPSSARTYAFTVRYPVTAVGNRGALASGSVSVTYRWIAVSQ